MRLGRPLHSLRDALSDPANRAQAPKVALGLAVGAVGGIVADALHVPLAYMLGSLFATMAIAVAGAPVAGSMALRSAFLIVIGLFLGEGFQADIVGRVAAWPVSLALAILYAPVAGYVAYLLYRRFARMSRADALFSAIPGGLTGVILMAGALGADERKVALSQSLRVAIVVAAAPALFFGLLGYQKPPHALAAHETISAEDALLLSAVAGFGIWALARARVPIPFMIGPMMASAGLRMAGLIDGQLPLWLVELALVVVGAAIGCRFAGVSLDAFRRVAVWTLIGTAAMIAISGVFALLAMAALGIGAAPALLAFAPGGVAEMAIIAIAIDADPGFVATHHFARIGFILFLSPIFGAWITRRWAREDAAKGAPAE